MARDRVIIMNLLTMWTELNQAIRRKAVHSGRGFHHLVRRGEARRPILVTGLPRSGTTWVGRTIALSDSIGYIHEPFNPQQHAGIRCSRLEGWFQYLCAENAHRFQDSVRRLMAFEYDTLAGLRSIRGPRSLCTFLNAWSDFILYRAGRARPLIKDPIAFFSAEWLARTFDMDVVFLLRHPAALFNSIKTLGWRPRYDSLLNQPLLMKHHLSSFEKEVREYSVHPPEDLVERSLLFYKCAHHRILQYRRDHPGWIFVRHEDLSLDPAGEFRHLFERLGIEYSGKIQRALRRRIGTETAAGRTAEPEALMSGRRAFVKKWKKSLSAEEIEKLHFRLEAWWRPFYSEEDW